MITAATAPACSVGSTPFSWDEVEPLPHCDPADNRIPTVCYSQHLKAHLLRGTFVLLFRPSNNVSLAGSAGIVVARIVDVLEAPTITTTPSVKVNIFKAMTEFSATETFHHPKVLVEPHLRHLPEIVQTSEICLIPSDEIVNLAFVFTTTSLQDSSNLFSICQGMSIAFLVRYRILSQERRSSEPVVMIDLPESCCLPFPSSYPNSGHHDCFASRMWHRVICVKLELAKLLGRYTQQQGLYGKEICRLSNFTPESWAFLKLQFANAASSSDESTVLVSAGASIRIRWHRVSQSGLILVKAAQVSKSCKILRFETKAHLKHLCTVFGESSTAGQRCRLPKISAPKPLYLNDVINVVCCGSDIGESEFNARTVRDGIDLEFDGRNELFISVRYSQFLAYTAKCLVLNECDPLLSSLIRRCDPIQRDICDESDDDEEIDNTMDGEDGDDSKITIRKGSEFEDRDGCLYRVASMNLTHIVLYASIHKATMPRMERRNHLTYN